MSEQSLVWECCNNSSQVDDNYIQCVKCKCAYHFASLLLDPVDVGADWKCQKCARRKLFKEYTPAHATQKKPESSPEKVTKRSNKRPALQSPPQVVEKPLSGPEVREIVMSVVHTEIKNAVIEISASMREVFSAELKHIKNELSDVKNSIQFNNSEYEDFKSQHQETTKKVDALQKENTAMRSTIDALGAKVNILEQQTRGNNIELQCVPESRTENLVALVLNLSETLKCRLTEADIAFCTRIPKTNRTSPRPRSIVLQLASQRMRDNLLAAAVSYNKANPTNKLSTAHIGLEGERKPIFITEHLSPANKALHAATRQKAKECGYKYVWVRGGKISVRKDDAADYLIVKDSACLDKIVK